MVEDQSRASSDREFLAEVSRATKESVQTDSDISATCTAVDEKVQPTEGQKEKKTSDYLDQAVENGVGEPKQPRKVGKKRFAHGRKPPPAPSLPTNSMSEKTKLGYYYVPLQEKVSHNLEPGMMRSKGAPLPFVDKLTDKLNISGWKNIPIPLQQAFEDIIEALMELKQSHFENYNINILTQRAINKNQQAARTDVLKLKMEALENVERCDAYKEKSLAA